MLLRALSPQSVTVQHLMAGKEFGSGKKVNSVAGPKATQRAFESLFRGAKPTG